jgi:hypothetical protein
MAAIHIQMVYVPPPYHAARIEASNFPLPADILPRIRAFLATLVHAASPGGTSSEVLLQNEYIANGKEQFIAHVPDWHPQSGLGVWPDRPPPELWKVTDIFRMAAGEKVPLMYRVYRLTTGPKANAQAFEVLSGTGMVMVVLHSGSADELLARYKDTFLPGIKQPNLRIMPFYVPLLDFKSLHDRKPEDLRRWLGGASFYLRESPADKAILLLMDADLGSLLQQAGARQNGDGSWLIP